MAYTTINKPSLHFNTKLYTGTGSELAISGVGFQPDWTWIKRRDATANGGMFDVVRGATKLISSSQTDGEQTLAQSLKSFDSDGFTLGTGPNGYVNTSSSSTVSWNWKAGGAGSTNTSGSINSTVSVNTTAGFSIVKWTGDNNSSGTIGHGLGVAPSFYVVKRLDATDNWYAYSKFVGNTKVLYLDLTNSQSGASTNYWNNTDPTTTVFTVGDAFRSTGNYIAYCFADKKGYSKFGKYTGNGNADGRFVYTGFKPAFVMIKQINTTGNWALSDNKRNNTGGGNFVAHTLAANLANGESYFGGGSSNKQDYLSNGFKIRDTGGYANTDGGTYIYWAFAEEPLVANVGQGIPATAR